MNFIEQRDLRRTQDMINDLRCDDVTSNDVSKQRKYAMGYIATPYLGIGGLTLPPHSLRLGTKEALFRGTK